MVNNPILQALNNQTSNNTPLSEIKRNPQAVLQSMPQYQQAIQYINQNGGDPKTAFYNLAAQRGINPNDILNQIR